MKKLCIYVGTLARPMPRFSDVSDGLAFTVEHVAGHADSVIGIFVFAGGTLLESERLQ